MSLPDTAILLSRCFDANIQHYEDNLPIPDMCEAAWTNREQRKDYIPHASHSPPAAESLISMGGIVLHAGHTPV